MAFNVTKYTKVLLLSATLACNAWASAEDHSSEQKVRAASQAVQYKADQELAKKHDKWWDDFCRYVGMHDKEVSLERRFLRCGQYYHDVADKTPDQVLWLMSGGHGVLVPVKVSDEARSKYFNNHKLAMEKIVEASIKNQINYVGDHLKSKEIGDTFLENLNQQINDLMKGQKVSDARILQLDLDVKGLNLKIDRLNLTVADLRKDLAKEREERQKDKSDFLQQLKDANTRINALEIEVERKTGEVSTAKKLADQKDEYERKAKAEALEHQRIIDEKDAKAKAELDASKERENAAKERENAAKEMLKLVEQNSQKEKETQNVILENTRYRMELEFSKKELEMLKTMSDMFKNENESIKHQLAEKTSAYNSLQEIYNRTMDTLRTVSPEIYANLSRRNF